MLKLMLDKTAVIVAGRRKKLKSVFITSSVSVTVNMCFWSMAPRWLSSVFIWLGDSNSVS